jgi:hypothetical protein
MDSRPPKTLKKTPTNTPLKIKKRELKKKEGMKK